ncbi:hypothetical protein P154DRAFT_581244 [Amniculicola lignicola CBS 123094]|uniref:Uncharacterized protein n=1 Tax=Amniculicola lignicola CBS 123094 TaxID=1392246 RepID=A0A6A5VZY2_9PLEO|nr:hypothetical protein P154DRAFT_581244 [Amniculicola lignicola CBS 123094]
MADLDGSDVCPMSVDEYGYIRAKNSDPYGASGDVEGLNIAGKILEIGLEDTGTIGVSLSVWLLRGAALITLAEDASRSECHEAEDGGLESDHDVEEDESYCEIESRRTGWQRLGEREDKGTVEEMGRRAEAKNGMDIHVTISFIGIFWLVWSFLHYIEAG